MSGYLAVSISDEKGASIEVREGKPSLSDMQAVVDGYIETAFRLPSPYRPDVSIDAYVNEEGLLMSLPMVISVNDQYGQRTFAGNMVIVGGDERTGETVELTDKELSFIQHCAGNVDGFLDFVL